MTRVLLVDDSPTQAMQYQFLLEEAGLQVQLAEGGSQALELIAGCLPDIVLTDLQMPDMDGLQLVQQLQKHYPALPVVLMTGYGSEEIALKALKMGAASYVPKQILEREIVNTLTSVLNLVAAEREQEQVLGFRRRLQEEFVLENDPEVLPALMGHLESSLKAARMADRPIKLRIITALREALENALFHGNLEVSSKLRESDQPTYYSTAAARRHQEPYKSRKIYLTAEITDTEIRYIIRDEGPGFDPKTIPDPTDPANIVKASGRGLLLINTFMDKVIHNATGNQITMIKRRN